MTAEFVMVPCPVCCRERRLPITAKRSVWKMWAQPCLYCRFMDGGGERFLRHAAKIRATT